MNKIKLLNIVLLLLAGIIFLLKDYSYLTQNINIDNDRVVKNTLSLSVVPDIHQRSLDQTYLTFPEWFLVHAPQEQANFLSHSTSTNFPYMNHVYQLWQSYGEVYDEIKDEYEFNTGYHVMIMVIGISSSIEYGGKAIYEQVIGRLTDTSRSEKMTDEDILYGEFANDYVDFINHTPWYAFDFSQYLGKLWKETPIFGDNFLRKIERRYMITSELMVKHVYAILIEHGTKSNYEAPSLETYIVVDTLAEGMEVLLPKLKIIEYNNDGTLLISIPRYQEFTSYSLVLVENGTEIKDIAGNTGDILVSLLGKDVEPIEEARELFMQPISTENGYIRKVIRCDVDELSTVIKTLQGQNYIIEHIYDY